MNFLLNKDFKFEPLGNKYKDRAFNFTQVDFLRMIKEVVSGEIVSQNTDIAYKNIALRSLRSKSDCNCNCPNCDDNQLNMLTDGDYEDFIQKRHRHNQTDTSYPTAVGRFFTDNMFQQMEEWIAEDELKIESISVTFEVFNLHSGGKTFCWFSLWEDSVIDLPRVFMDEHNNKCAERVLLEQVEKRYVESFLQDLFKTVKNRWDGV